MKLYTEEQVKKAMVDSYIIGTDRENNCLQIEEYILKNLIPIELPSDKEIRESSPHRLGGGNYNPLANFHRFEGAKWMETQILKQNK